MRSILEEETNREPLEFSILHRVQDNLHVGIEVGVDSEELYPVANYRILDATEEHPALVIGTSSAWPSSEVDGNALTLTAAQMLGSQFSGSIGLAYILDNSDWKVPGSVRYGLGGGYVATMIYDGDAVHPLITWRNDAFSFSFIMLGAEDPTISVTVGL